MKSLELLIERIYFIAKKNSNYKFSILIIDDHSTEDDNYSKLINKDVLSINHLRLKENFGHQKAIYIGLMYCKKNNVENILIMDSDGEDKPEDIIVLIKNLEKNEKNIIVAKRTFRTNTFFFKFLYFVYKVLFIFFTGKIINFGNFCIFTNKNLNILLKIPGLHKHVASTILKSNISLTRVPISRGSRYIGVSKMNYFKLILHGIRAIMIFYKQVKIRIYFCLLLATIYTIFSFLFFFNIVNGFFLINNIYSISCINLIISIVFLLLVINIYIFFLRMYNRHKRDKLSDNVFDYIDNRLEK